MFCFSTLYCIVLIIEYIFASFNTIYKTIFYTHEKASNNLGTNFDRFSGILCRLDHGSDKSASNPRVLIENFFKGLLTDLNQ